MEVYGLAFYKIPELWAYILQDARTTSYRCRFPSYSLDFSDQYNNVTNSTGHSWDPYIGGRVLHRMLDLAITSQIKTILDFLIFKKTNTGEIQSKNGVSFFKNKGLFLEFVFVLLPPNSYE